MDSKRLSEMEDITSPCEQNTFLSANLILGGKQLQKAKEDKREDVNNMHDLMKTRYQFQREPFITPNQKMVSTREELKILSNKQKYRLFYSITYQFSNRRAGISTKSGSNRNPENLANDAQLQILCT